MSAVSFCRHPTCSESAAVRVITPFGTGNFCELHGTELDPRDDLPGLPPQNATSFPTWLMEAFRHGPPTDPPLVIERPRPEAV